MTVALLFMALRLPVAATLSRWAPVGLFGVGLTLSVDGLAWLFGLGVLAVALSALVTGLARPGGRRVGTRFTMQAAFYPAVFARHGVAVVPPAADEQELVHTRYVGELVEGVFNDSTRTQLLEATGHMVRRDSLDGVILAGTELPLLLRTGTAHGVPLLDTTGIHVAAAVAALD